MRRLLPILIALGLAVVLVGGTMVMLNRARPAPTPTPEVESAVVRVNGEPISAQQWIEAYALDLLMSRQVGQPAPTPEETLDRLINDALLLQGYPQPVPDDAQVAKRLSELEAATGITTGMITLQLEAWGLPSEALTETIRHLMRVEAANAALQAEGKSVAAWITEARRKATLETNTEIKAAVLKQLGP